MYGPTKTGKVIRTVDTTFFNSDFDSYRGITGATAALARVFAGITGTSGENSNPDDFMVSYFGTTGDRARTIFESPDNLSITGATMT